ncbi:hypothetical protein ABMA28_001083 [Loxostege sticticalis]|uniref:Reverse transcriptase domain-containing protein n=1 Tax=Loxostege sticticalis TaxID=481309 RepID=A0ABD0T4J2_LOXSC
MGDFNTCLIKKDSRSLRLTSLLGSCNLNILPLNPTHFFPNCAPSLLDLIVVSSLNHVAKYGQCHADAFSFHDLIYLSYKIRPPRPKRKFLLQRNFSGMNIDALKLDAAGTDWSVVEAAEDVDEKVRLFNTLLIQLFDKHAPVRPVKLKHAPAPWLTEELKSLRNKKNAAKNKFKLDPSDKNREKYKILRNRCNTMCRDAQRRHIHESVKNGDPAKVWKFLKSIGIGRTHNDPITKDINIDLLNKHFSTTVALDGLTKTRTLNQLSALPTPDHPPFNFCQVSDCDVKKNVLSIASNAVGSDSVSRIMIIPLLDIISPIISHILNYSLSSSVFPAIWKDAQITPLPKKPKPSTYTDYRPISILPFLSKVMERVVHQQLSSFLSENLVLNPFQSGFRPGHSTVTALVKITDDIRLGIDEKRLTLLALLDFSNAFNNVDFDLLLGILRSLNISPTVLDWFHSYLHGRRQRIRAEDCFSAWCDISAGVPQGGVLSPLLFSIFINSITFNLSSSFHLYADDLQIYSQGTLADLSDVVNKINTDLNRILNWSTSYGLKVNPSKTQVIVLGGSRQIARIDWNALPPIIFDGVQIPYSQVVKNLGVYIDSSLTWTTQVAEVSRRVFATAASINRLRNFLPIPTKIALVQALLFPILDYADCCYLDLNESLLSKLERLQNFCIRIIYGLRNFLLFLYFPVLVLCICFATVSYLVIARTWHAGAQHETRCAVFPVQVKIMMAAALHLKAASFFCFPCKLYCLPIFRVLSKIPTFFSEIRSETFVRENRHLNFVVKIKKKVNELIVVLF